MLSACLFAALAPIEPIIRDDYGVAHIKAATQDQAWFLAGYACAQDRLWQLENSRRLTQGRMSEAFGQQFVASDVETLRSNYTPAELDEQFRRLSKRGQDALHHYAMGVNFWILEAMFTGRLPDGYEKNAITPDFWSTRDSMSIAVSLLRRFGNGPSGELRNMAGLEYFRSQPGIKGREFDMVDDALWQDEPSAPTTIAGEDDRQAALAPFYPRPTRAQTEAQVAKLPRLTLVDLLPALRVAQLSEQSKVAEAVGVPFKVGSYAIVVSKQRATTGFPLLLSGPQMGFTNPSIVHEMSIEAPGMSIRGADIPGIPGIIVGTTRDFAWGLTSGVADTDDVVVYKADDPALKLTSITQTVKPKQGLRNIDVVQERSEVGPVLLKAKGYVFVRKSSYWKRETTMLDALMESYSKSEPADIVKAVSAQPMSFNYFYATRSGHIGYVYCGDVPVRAPGVDARFPSPADPRNSWRGILPKSRMPQVRDPKGGLITNWNNKPARWWPNLDSPVWGEIQHVDEIRRSLGAGKIGPDSIRATLRAIAMKDENWHWFGPEAKAAAARELAKRYIRDPGPITPFARSFADWDGIQTAGTAAPIAFPALVDALREEIFVPVIGNFVTPDFFRQAIQPSLIWRALESKTRIDFLRGRTKSDVMDAAMARAVVAFTKKFGDDPKAWSYVPSSIAATEAEPAPYRNRGTYIQLIELGDAIIGRNVAPPGVAETGPHRVDQMPLARDFEFKAMSWRD